MSEVKRDCPRCDAKTLHQQYTTDVFGDRVGIGERLFVAAFTMGFSELETKTVRICLRCGYKRTV